MVIQRKPEEGGASEASPSGNDELGAAKQKIAALEASLESAKKEQVKATESLMKLDKLHADLLVDHDKLREANADLSSRAAALSPAPAEKEIVSDAVTEEEKAQFDRVKDQKFGDGFVYCEARATVFGHGEVKYAGQRFWQKRELAVEQENRGELEILVERS